MTSGKQRNLKNKFAYKIKKLSGCFNLEVHINTNLLEQYLFSESQKSCSLDLEFRILPESYIYIY